MANTKPWLMAGVVGIVLALYGCGAKAADPAPGPAGARGGDPAPAGGPRSAGIPVQAVVVQAGPLAAAHDGAGSVVPVTQSQVATQIAGVVSRVLHLAGDWVSAGQTVVQLDDSQLRLSVSSAQAALDSSRINLTVAQETTTQADPKLMLQLQSAQSALTNAQRSYDANVALLKIGGSSQSLVDAAKSQLEQAQANLQTAQAALDQNRKADTENIAQLRLAIDQAGYQLRQAQINLENSSIKAPFNGQIAAVNVNPGMYVSSNTPAFVVVSADRQINFGVPPADASALPAGSTVTFAYQGHRYDLKIVQAPSAPISGVVPMVAIAPKGVELPYGSVGTVSYSLTLASGTLVPVASLQTNENQNFVFAVVNGKAVMRPITILSETGVSAAVTGIDAGSQVIVSPPPGLVDGASVRVMTAGPGAGMAPGAQSTPGASGPGRGAGGDNTSGAPAGGAGGRGGRP